MTDTQKALACLSQLSAGRADSYESWITTGMILKSAGCSVHDWDSWSRRSGKYRAGVCEQKWNSFNGAFGGASANVGTLIAWVKEDGGKPPIEKRRHSEKGHALTWDSEIGRDKSGLAVDLPAPATDWQSGDLIRYLETLFRPEEYVSYAVESRQDQNGRAVPVGKGNYWQTCSELIARIRKFPEDIQSAIGSWNPSVGAWIRPNPVDGQGIRNDNVTEYRHVLVESDTMPMRAQLATIRHLNLPCTAIIHSGGKSVHAIVKIDAGKDLTLYRRRIAFLFDVLNKNGFMVDGQCKNPARLSRMPGVSRGDKPQYLIALNAGAPSWQAWEVAQTVKTEPITELPTTKALGDLVRPISGQDPNELIRFRYLSRGGGLLLVAQTGAGKSSFVMQAAMMWALGCDFFGLTPVKPVRTLIIQAENDEGDMAEMRDGVLDNLNLSDEEIETINSMIHVTQDNSHTSFKFGDVLRGLLANHNPDLLVIDPALAYLGGDSGQQKDVSLFLRNILNPILTEFRIGLILVHHTTKPPKGDDRSKWQGGDYAYLGGGSAEWFNWARGIINIEATGDIYRLRLPKRGKRVGWRTEEGTAELTKWIAHSREPDKICWREADPDEIPSKGQNSSAGRKPKKKPDIKLYAQDAVTLVESGPMLLADFKLKLRDLEFDGVRLGKDASEVLYHILTDPENQVLFTTKKQPRLKQFIGQKTAIKEKEAGKLKF